MVHTPPETADVSPRNAKEGLRQFNFQENTRLLWEAGHDSTQLLIDEAHEIGTDFWLQLRMNDWCHWGPAIEDPDRPGRRRS